MEQSKKQRINQVLKDLYYSSCSQDCLITPNLIYNYLVRLDIPFKSENKTVSESFFDDWINRFKNIPNIDVFCSLDWKYFCQFKNGDVDNDCVKMYIPLDYEHLYEGANLIFDFLSKSNISHTSKIGSEIRLDDVVVRLNNLEDAVILQSFIDNNSYIQEGFINSNPFIFNNNGIGYSFDGVLSYNYSVATIISEYISERKDAHFDIKNINVEDFLEYINEFEKSNILSLDDNYHDSAVGYASLVINLLKLNLISNNMKDFYKYFYTVLNIDKVSLSNKIKWNISKSNSQLSEKEELLKELILVTMKKYPKGYDYNNLEYSGFDYIDNYLSGDINGVTRINGLRSRISKGLKVSDVYDIVFSSGMIGKSNRDKVDNYIKMIMLNEIIRCMKIRMPDLYIHNLNRFMVTNDYRLITNKVGSVRTLAYTLNGSDIRNFLNELGVSDIYKYMEKYYFENRDLERGRA